jgi:hypothetical protein
MNKNLVMYENPSAGKFDPVPASSTPRESRSRGFAAMLVGALFAAQWLFPRAGASYWFAALAFAVMILEWVLVKNEADEKGPYTDQSHLTR